VAGISTDQDHINYLMAKKIRKSKPASVVVDDDNNIPLTVDVDN
jgi:hypothetical protein